MGTPRKPRHIEVEELPPPPPKPSASTRAGRTILKAVFQPKRLLLLALVPIVGSLAPVVWRHWPQAQANPLYLFKPSDIHITSPPRPVPTNLVERALGTANLDAELTILDRALLPRLAEAFSKEPWVKQVVQLRKGLPAHVEVDLEYRLPIAMIDVKSGVYPIDEEGILLPPGDFTSAEIRRYPLVTGVRSLPAGPPGVAWGDPVVLGAARIAASLAPQWDKFDLVSIQAPAPPSAAPALDDLTFELHTRGGSKVIWGRAPGTGHPGELTVEQKLGRLDRYVTDFGPFDAPGPPFEVDIRPWQEIVRKPIAAVAGNARPRN